MKPKLLASVFGEFPNGVNAKTMKRAILVLLVSSVLTLAAAMANATSPPECGKSYAFQVHGAEPSINNDAPLFYVAGVGQITFGPPFQVHGGQGSACPVTHLEMIYNDNDVIGLSLSPASCNYGTSFLANGVPCFDGGDHEAAPGVLTASTGSPGGATLSIDPSFTWVNGNIAAVSLPLSFTLYATAGDSTVVGTSVSLPGPTLPASSPPANPVLTMVMQKQSTRVTLPVQGAFSTGLGEAPYLGRSTVYMEGFGAPSADPYSSPITGAYGSAVGESQIFATGDAGGIFTYNANDNVGNITPLSCSYFILQFGGNFADATSNDENGGCNVGAIPSNIVDTSAVQWGPSDTSSYWIATSSLQPALNGLGQISFAGEIVIGTSYPSATPPGIVTNQVAPQTLVAGTTTSTGFVKMTNTSPVGCLAELEMPYVSDGRCTLYLAGPPDQQIAVPAYSPSAQYATTNCTCNPGPKGLLDSVSSMLTFTSFGSECPLSGTTSYTITCKN
jgi:hypothetical protein